VSREAEDILTDPPPPAADERLVYGAEPDAPGAVALSIDTNDTQSPAEGFIGPLLFRSRAGLP